MTIVLGILLIVSWANLFGVSETEAQTKVQDYLDSLPIAGSAIAESVAKEHDLFKVDVNIQGEIIETYVTKDGEIMFTSPIDLTVPPITGATTQEEVPKTCDDLTKQDEPLIEAFVVSYCPYGTQMQRILAEVPLKDNIKVRYIGSMADNQVTSMHGEQEAQENLKQICIREEQSDKFWDYVSCFIKAGDSASCLVEASIDTSKLDNCMTSTGIDYAKEDFALANKYQVSGSPTLILNGERVSEFDFGGRNAEALKTLICCGSSKELSGCSETLETASAATGFSVAYSGETSSGSC